MTTAGWIFMTASIGFVAFLVAYCFCRVLRQPGAAEDLHAPPTIETGDEET